jgi:hypothetical protein
MTRVFLLLAIGAAVLATGDITAFAKSRERAQAVTPASTDFSAARRHTRAHIRVHPRAYAAPLAAPAPTWGFRPADPSFGPYYSLWAARRQEPNRCIEDLGYGRWRYCDWD